MRALGFEPEKDGMPEKIPEVDGDVRDTIDYEEFATGLAQFSDGDPDDVLRFIFSVHSETGDDEG